MKISIAAILAWVALACPAYAQTLSKGYVEGVAQSAFGNVTSQSYGVELGVSLKPSFQIFGEVGFTKDTAPASLGTSAQAIANFLSQTQSSVAYTAASASSPAHCSQFTTGSSSRRTRASRPV